MISPSSECPAVLYELNASAETGIVNIHKNEMINLFEIDGRLIHPHIFPIVIAPLF